MTELLPCPFCGGKAQLAQSDIGCYSVVCAKCNTGIFKPRYEQGEWSAYRTEAEAIRAWNTRYKRTCKNLNKRGYSLRLECSSCGYSSITTNCVERLDEKQNYCPNCGAKVVDE